MFSLSLQAEETPRIPPYVVEPPAEQRPTLETPTQPPAVAAAGGTAPWKAGDNQWDAHHFKVDYGEPPFATLVVYLPGTTCDPMYKDHIKWLMDKRCVVVQPSMNQLHKSKRGKAFKARREIYVCMYTIIYVYIARCLCKLFRVRLPCVVSSCVFIVCFP
jgi:hypothetical protein